MGIRNVEGSSSQLQVFVQKARFLVASLVLVLSQFTGFSFDLIFFQVERGGPRQWGISLVSLHVSAVLMVCFCVCGRAALFE